MEAVADKLGFKRLDAKDRGVKCKQCGETRQLLVIFPSGQRMYGGCRCRRHRDGVQGHAEAMRVLNEHLNVAGVDPELRWPCSGFQSKVFDRTDDEVAWGLAKDWARRYCAWARGDGERPKRGLAFVSPEPGIGKSHLAAAIVRHVMLRAPRRIRCHVETDAIRDLRNSWRARSGERPEDVWGDMTGASIIVWDDWCAEWDMPQGMRFDIVESWRQSRGLVLLTSNYRRSEMEEMLPTRIFSRLCGLVDFVEMRGTVDHRR